jgi:ABC-type uncharacterized transport system YnjBCD ATPase subunit
MRYRATGIGFGIASRRGAIVLKNSTYYVENPSFLFLDEPFSGLDWAIKAEF